MPFPARLPFRIKICGITQQDDVGFSVRGGADAIGINFCPQSKRFVELDQARLILHAVPPGLVRVGVFADADPTCILDHATALGLDAVQLHGHENPAIVAELPNIRIIKAIRVSAETLPQAMLETQAWQAGRHVNQLLAILLDAHVPGELGGTGEAIPFDVASQIRKAIHEVPLILAGGLHALSVASAIQTVRPDAIDVASGVEKRPGIKDFSRIQQLVEAAKKGWETL